MIIMHMTMMYYEYAELNENAVIELINIIAQDTYEKGASGMEKVA